MTPFFERVAAIVRARSQSYGRPAHQHALTAQLWNAYLGARWSRCGGWKDLTAAQVAQLNILQKLSRAAWGEASVDTPMDVAGYASNWADCEEGVMPEKCLPLEPRRG